MRRIHLATVLMLAGVLTNVAPAAPADSAAAQVLPRRLLAIGVHHYLHGNSLRNGKPGRDLNALVERMTQVLQVPASQTVVVTEGLAEPSPVTRPVIDKAVAGFLDGCRPQDRILLLFVGHVADVEGKAYLVPFEGNWHEPHTMIALDDLYDRLGKCKARQKVLILDVCRLNSERYRQRLGSERMSAAVERRLQSPPDGVQVWSSCVEGQNSCEGNFVAGSAFLQELYEALDGPAGKRVPLGLQRGDDAIPIHLLARGDATVPGVDRATETLVEKQFKKKQTSRLAGGEAPGNVRSDPRAPLPAKLTVPRAVPPLLAAAFHATVMLEKHAGSTPEIFRGDLMDIQERVPEIQKPLAGAELELREALDELKQAGEQRNRETSALVQAQFDYVQARLKARIASLHEYNYLLSEIRTEMLPARGPMHTGWQMISRDRLSCKGQEGREAQRLAEEARLLIFTINRTYTDLPWKTLAEKDSILSVGLQWVAIP